MLTLGNLDFANFEIPSFVQFGGSQRVAVHDLLGGGRLIDTMGRDDAVLTWSGVFSGRDAGDRARTLDAMRVEGQDLQLTWDAFAYVVVLTNAEFQFRNPWWITYRVRCTVLFDTAHSPNEVSTTVGDAILSDLNAVPSVAGVTDLLTSISLPGALSPGSAAVRDAVMRVAILRSGLASEMSIAEAALNGLEIATAVSASGTLAQLCIARGYLGRAASNLGGLLS